ncbi:hypothetical protein F4778DRAFT_783300 [Xylariomycetidae sp. FL2044]|nr:hypothetical protein F4778DRAFT_783300 [Xylariomycetidae sp. FL2044]
MPIPSPTKDGTVVTGESANLASKGQVESSSEPSHESAAGVSDMAEQIRRLQEQLKELELQKVAAEDKLKTKKTTPSEAPATTPIQPRIVPSVRSCNWEQFKNYFGDEERAAVEILEIGLQHQKDVQQEVSRRIAAKEGVFNAETDSWSFTTDSQQDSWIQRIRIHSKSILSILAAKSGKYGLFHLNVDRPITFVRPFKALIFIHDEVKEELEMLKKYISRLPKADISVPDSNSQTPGAEGENVHDSAPGTSTSEPEIHLALPSKLVSEDSVAELESYVKFMDENIMPFYYSLRKGPLPDTPPKKIRYEDLWYLFQPGELLYMRPPIGVEKARSNSTQQRIWRLWELIPTKFEWRVDDIEKKLHSTLGRKREASGLDDESPGEMVSGTELRCYYLDYSGTNFCPVYQSFMINIYEGELDITQLKAYPLRFHPKRESVVENITQDSIRFHKYVKNAHQLAYDGWSLEKNVLGKSLSSETGSTKDYVDSEVIIDFEEAFQYEPDWKPNFFWSVHGVKPGARWATDNFKVIQWDNKQRSKQISETSELYEDDIGVGPLESHRWLHQDRYLTLSTYTETNEPPRIEKLEGEELLLLPTRLFAYSLRQRKFYQVDIRHLREIEQVQQPFKVLQIEPDHKYTIESLLVSHFDKKNLAKGPGPAIPDQDLIRGKGRGVVILLHGAPGVGKTATAEAVAQQYGKPLFAITCGDLGYQPSEVESELSEIFRLAQVWDCILLLDEADVFLTQRAVNDLKRNAMVSTILRILEYYQGVLFLTSNRPGVLDEALKSRVHVSLYYPPLDLKKTQEIFQLNLDRLELIEQRRSQNYYGGGASGEDNSNNTNANTNNNNTKQDRLTIFREDIYNYAATHYHKHGLGLGYWNGRQIRNAFQIAAALARYDSFRVPNSQPQLRASHFEKVAEGTYSYDFFRLRTLGKGDTDLARTNEHRDDTFGMMMPGGGGPGALPGGVGGGGGGAAAQASFKQYRAQNIPTADPAAARAYPPPPSSSSYVTNLAPPPGAAGYPSSAPPPGPLRPRPTDEQQQHQHHQQLGQMYNPQYGGYPPPPDAYGR